MAHNVYLKFNGATIPHPNSYSLDFTDIESESSGQTEAGTIQRDVVRVGVVSINVSFSLSAEWVKKMTAYSKQSKIIVGYFDPYELATTSTEMYMVDYKVNLAHDTSYNSLWSVSFTLKEY